mmetsp:Transcript_39707/g.69000  ORF Transcript_39707/g.69000 Transcript_39707/m.69000 type:complete len:313 (+) Transcript_39707:1183-2121(+)
MIVLNHCLLLLSGQTECACQHCVVIVRSVFAVSTIDDKIVEALLLSHFEQVCPDVACEPVEVMVVDVNDWQVHLLRCEHGVDGLAVRPDVFWGPIHTLSRVLDTELMKLQASCCKHVNLPPGPCCEGFQRELWRKHPVGHGDDLRLQQLTCGVILWRVLSCWVVEVASMEVVWLPRHPHAPDTNSWPVVLGHHFCSCVEEWLADLCRQFHQTVHILRTLEGVSRHVVWQSENHDLSRIKPTNQASLVLSPTCLVANASSCLSPDLRVLLGDGADGARLGVVALLRGVARCHRDPAAALRSQLATKLRDVVFI